MKRIKNNKQFAINLLHKVLGDSNGKIVSIKELHNGYTNISFDVIFQNKNRYQVRIPHCGDLINREYEYAVLKLIKDKNFIYFDRKTGIAIKKWINGKNPKFGWNRGFKYLNALFTKIKELHAIPIKNKKIFAKTSFDQYNQYLFHLRFDFQQKYLQLIDLYKEDNYVISHADINGDNMIVDGRGTITLIDFEWADLAPDYWDYANFVRESRINYHRVDWSKYINDFDMDKFENYIFLTSVYAHMWTWAMPESPKILRYRRKTLRQVHWYARGAFKNNEK